MNTTFKLESWLAEYNKARSDIKEAKQELIEAKAKIVALTGMSYATLHDINMNSNWSDE